jgi:hypothetical protein
MDPITKNKEYRKAKKYIEDNIDDPNITPENKTILIKYYESLTIDNAKETHQNAHYLIHLPYKLEKYDFLMSIYYYAFMIMAIGLILLGMCWSIMNFVSESYVYYWILEHMYSWSQLVFFVGVSMFVANGH